jgi:hypothetical protein
MGFSTESVTKVTTRPPPLSDSLRFCSSLKSRKKKIYEKGHATDASSAQASSTSFSVEQSKVLKYVLKSLSKVSSLSRRATVFFRNGNPKISFN